MPVRNGRMDRTKADFLFANKEKSVLVSDDRMGLYGGAVSPDSDAHLA